MILVDQFIFFPHRNHLELMLRTYCKPCEEDMAEIQSKALSEVTQELVRQLTQPNNCVREQVSKILLILVYFLLR